MRTNVPHNVLTLSEMTKKPNRINFEVFELCCDYYKVIFRGYVGDNESRRFFDLHLSFVVEDNITFFELYSYFIDLIIFLRDAQQPKSHEPDVNTVVRLCDMHNIPLATNLATAELLIKSLDRGDLEWREIYK